MKKLIDHFCGEYYFLSNFYKRAIYWKDYWFPTSEHVYHSEKVNEIISLKTQLMVQYEIDKYNNKLKECIIDNIFKKRLDNELTTSEAKKRYNLSKLCGFLREDWFDVNLQIMEDINIVKFTYFLDLREKLLSTGDAILVEGNYWGDDFWGMIKDKETGKWKGKNKLGIILMNVRERIKEGKI